MDFSEASANVRWERGVKVVQHTTSSHSQTPIMVPLGLASSLALGEVRASIITAPIAARHPEIRYAMPRDNFCEGSFVYPQQWNWVKVKIVQNNACA